MDAKLRASNSSLSASSSMRSRPERMAWTAASSNSRQMRPVMPSLKLRMRLRNAGSCSPEAWRSGKLAPKLARNWWKAGSSRQAGSSRASKRSANCWSVSSACLASGVPAHTNASCRSLAKKRKAFKKMRCSRNVPLSIELMSSMRNMRTPNCRASTRTRARRLLTLSLAGTAPMAPKSSS